jgi:TetR/AcrR family transcriptional repressor of nem operon
MRYERDRKTKTRGLILDAASRRFREDGIANSGVAAVMADAGLTNGAFYAHFASKEDLVREVVANTLEKRRLRTGSDDARSALADWIRTYLSASHRDHPGTGCPTSALVGEIGRHSKPTRVAFTAKAIDAIDAIAEQLSGPSDGRTSRATALYALLIGTLQLARAVTDETRSDGILESGIAAAIALAGIPHRPQRDAE